MAQMEERMNEEKEFHLYLDFPPKIRLAIIDEMQTRDRCRFTRCSKQTNKDAKSSEKFVHQLSFSFVSNDHIRIIVGFFNELNNANAGGSSGYELTFREIIGRRIKHYRCDEPRVSWGIELVGPRSIFEQAVEEFKNLLQTHQDSLRMLKVEDFSEANNTLEGLNFGVTSMRNLKSIDVDGSVNLRQFLSILKRPLKTFYSDRNGEDIYDEIYQVTDEVVLDDLNITNEQFRRITARNVTISIGRLSERNVLQFIRSWQDGTIGREINFCAWNLEGSMFDTGKLLRRLRLSDEDVRFGSAEIKHYNETGKSATFSWFASHLVFEPIE